MSSDNSLWRQNALRQWEKVADYINTNTVQYIINQNIATNNLATVAKTQTNLVYSAAENGKVLGVKDANLAWVDGGGSGGIDTNAVQYIIDQNVATNNIVGFEMFEEQVEYFDGEISRLGREKRGIYDLDVDAHFLTEYSTVRIGSQVIPSKDITIQKEASGYHVYAFSGTFIGTNICYVDDNGVLTSIGASITLGGVSPTVGTKVIVPAEQIAIVSKTQTNLVYSAAENGKVLGVKNANLAWVTGSAGGTTVYLNGSGTPSASANVWTPDNGGTNGMVLTSSGLYSAPQWKDKGETETISGPLSFSGLFSEAGLPGQYTPWHKDIIAVQMQTGPIEGISDYFPNSSGYVSLDNQHSLYKSMVFRSNTNGETWQNLMIGGVWHGWKKTTITFDEIYPVGSVYINVGSSLPAIFTAEGRTWEKITDGRFLMSANGTASAGDTGGNNSMTLTTANMPKHTHAWSTSQATTSSQDLEHTHSFSGSVKGSFTATTGKKNTAPTTSGSFSAASTGSSAASGSDASQYTYTLNAAVSGTSGKTKVTHNHTVTVSGSNSNVGGDTAFDNRPSYLAVSMWKRTN